MSSRGVANVSQSRRWVRCLCRYSIAFLEDIRHNLALPVAVEAVVSPFHVERRPQSQRYLALMNVASHGQAGWIRSGVASYAGIATLYVHNKRPWGYTYQEGVFPSVHLPSRTPLHSQENVAGSQVVRGWSGRGSQTENDEH